MLVTTHKSPEFEVDCDWYRSAAAAQREAIRGVLHSLSGEASHGEAGARRNLHFGFGGPRTYKTSSPPEGARGVGRLRAARDRRAVPAPSTIT